jgi:hypothetical protein
MTIGTFTSAIGFPFFVISVLYRLYNPPLTFSFLDWLLHTISLVLFGAGAVTVLLLGYIGTRKRKNSESHPVQPWLFEYMFIFLFPLYYAIATWAAWRSLYEIMKAPFRWNKTTHGITKKCMHLPSFLQEVESSKACVTMTSNNDMVAHLNS